MRLLDLVVLKVDLPEDSLKKGTTGTVVDIFTNKKGFGIKGFEVEFFNPENEALYL